MEKNIVIASVVAATAGGVVGGVVTYLTVNKKLRDRYEAKATEEIEDVKRRYSLLRKEDGSLSILQMAQEPSAEVKAAVEKGKHLMEQLGYSDGDKDEEEPVDKTSTTLSIFDRTVPAPDEEDDEDEDEDDYEVIEGAPFLIAEAEYFENEPEYMLDTLTYYELDDTLTDENNSQIDRVDETIGGRHLHMFKKSNTGKTSLYVRNDDHQTLYEIILVEQSYAAVILGMDEEELGLKEPKPKLKKMKRDVD